MSDVRLLIVFNHHHEAIVNRVLQYNNRFCSEIQIATPFNTSQGLRYSTGSYLWQGALVAYLQELDSAEGHTLVIHDDVALNSALNLDDLAPVSGEVVRFHKTYRLSGSIGMKWAWQFRTLTNWFSSKSVLFGSGCDDVVAILKGSLLYQQNQERIDALGSSRLDLEDDVQQIPILTAWLQTYFPDRKQFDFELPLFVGNADFFMFPNSQAPLIEDFLRRSLECGLFVEVAIPTLVEWLTCPTIFEHERQMLPFGEEYAMFEGLTSISDIEDFFSRSPDLLSIHPVKFSRFATAEGPLS